jgi:TrpR-related protein YerC/YecD
MNKLHSPSVDRLFQSFLNLNSIEECYAYFEDLCTVKEIQDMAQRLDTAILLSQGQSYQKIAEEVDVSTATIGRVSKCLNYGAGGYQKAISTLQEGAPEV